MWFIAQLWIVRVALLMPVQFEAWCGVHWNLSSIQCTVRHLGQQYMPNDNFFLKEKKKKNEIQCLGRKCLLPVCYNIHTNEGIPSRLPRNTGFLKVLKPQMYKCRQVL